MKNKNKVIELIDKKKDIFPDLPFICGIPQEWSNDDRPYLRFVDPLPTVIWKCKRKKK